MLDPTKDYTFYITGLISAGTGHVFFSGTDYYDTDYAGGTWEIHQGAIQDAPTAAGGMPALPSSLVPSTFINGTLLLSGTFSSFHVSVTKSGSSPPNGSFLANYAASGGLHFPQVGNGTALFQGLWCVTMKPTGCTPLTYSAHPDGKWDLTPTTFAPHSTWGMVKQLYR